MPKLAVNIDHIATIREARKTNEPDPIYAALMVEQAGANGLVLHLRQDRRHIQERDLEQVMNLIRIPVNLEMAATQEMIGIALRYHPQTVTLVPETPEEVSTEGGLDIASDPSRYRETIATLKQTIPEISLFIDPDPLQIRVASEIGADSVELHTGEYAEAEDSKIRCAYLTSLQSSAELAHELSLAVRAGHGLTYLNVGEIAAIPSIFELSIGHSIISRSVWVGLQKAIQDMLMLINPSGVLM
jgi:pyridoxine 5-phosphate synthase